MHLHAPARPQPGLVHAPPPSPPSSPALSPGQASSFTPRGGKVTSDLAPDLQSHPQERRGEERPTVASGTALLLLEGSVIIPYTCVTYYTFSKHFHLH